MITASSILTQFQEFGERLAAITAMPLHGEDYPGQFKEMRRNKVIEFAHHLADTIIMDAADGSTEELDFMTLGIAYKFLFSINARIASNLLKKELEERARK